MRNLLFCALALCGVTVLAAETRQAVPPGEFRITGALTGVPDSTAIILYKADGNRLIPIAPDTLIDGKFMFRDTVSTTRIVYLLGADNGVPDKLFEVWVAPGKEIRITGRGKLISTWNIESGIPEQIEENGYRDFTKAETTELMLQQAAEEKTSAAQRDSMRLATRAAQNKVAAKTLLFMQSATVTPIWIEKLRHFASFLQYGFYADSREEMQTLYGRMSAAQQQSEKGRFIQRYLYPEPTIGIGDEMADGDLYDLEGNRRRLAEFKGRYILLDFWGRGCGPCVQSIPELEEVSKQYMDTLSVVSICLDKKNIWKECVAEQGLTGNQWNELAGEAHPLAAKYQMKGIPHFVLIHPDGRIVDIWSGYCKGSIVQKLNEHIK